MDAFLNDRLRSASANAQQLELLEPAWLYYHHLHGCGLPMVASLPPEQAKDKAALVALYIYLTARQSGRKISLKLAASLAGANTTYVTLLVGLVPEQRYEIANGRRTIAQVLADRRRNHTHKNCPRLAACLRDADASARLKAAKTVGVSQIWDTMCAPLLDQPTNTNNHG